MKTFDPPFNQSPPELTNTFEADPLLAEYMRRKLPDEINAAVLPELHEMGEIAVHLHRLSAEDRLNEPVLTQWSPWGERIDHIELTQVWKRAEPIAARMGVVGAAYEPTHGRFARLHQFALAYLFAPSSDFYGCPLAMTDGAARTLLDNGNQALIDRAVPRLTSRDPSTFWTSGQWMTESTGGSDVGKTETVATRDALEDDEGVWRLHGRKWFTSAATSQMALTLARPEGNPAGGHGLALFYVECDPARGETLLVNRLKDKLGTRKLPTAELSLVGMPAIAVDGDRDGIKKITPMLNVTRTWNAVTSVSSMRRALSLAQDYARRREAFGAPLSDKPLHVDTLAGMCAETEGAFHLAFRVAELLGRHEHHDGDDEILLRVLTPIAKLTTARQAVSLASEALETFGGAGYVEDTGLPALLRDAQVLSIWEGTTNVLSLDVLRGLARGDGLPALRAEVRRAEEAAKDPALEKAASVAAAAFGHAAEWLASAMKVSQDAVEAGARRFAMTLGRAIELALLVEHAQWCLDHGGDRRARAAALRFAQSRVDQIAWMDAEDAALLA